MTQYEAILDHLRKHRVATVRDLLRYSNYPSARLFEMTDTDWRIGTVLGKFGGRIDHQGFCSERIIRTWVQRNGKKVRLYCLTKA